MMKRLLILLLLPIIGFSQGTPIFSEYGEGSSFNKWIEIYNPTSQDISLDDYRYNFCWNGCDNLDWEFSLAFDSGYTLLPGEIYLLVHYDASNILLNASNQTTNLLSNGNDVIGLFHTSLNTIVDIIGVFDSATAWGKHTNLPFFTLYSIHIWAEKTNYHRIFFHFIIIFDNT